MNKFLTHEGGQPIWLEDIDFMQTSVRDALKVLISSLSGNTGDVTILGQACILQGCEQTNTGISHGYIYYTGEILPFDEYVGDIEDYMWLEQYTIDSGERIFKNGNRKACYQERRVRIGKGNGDNIDYFRNLRRLRDLLGAPKRVGQIVQDTAQIYVDTFKDSLHIHGKSTTSGDNPVQYTIDYKSPNSGLTCGVAISRQDRELAMVEAIQTTLGISISLYPMNEEANETEYYFDIWL